MATYRSVNRLMMMFNDFQKQTQPDLSPTSFATSEIAAKKFQELFPRLQVSQLRKSAKVREIHEQLSKYPCYRFQKFSDLSLKECYSSQDYQAINIETVKLTFGYLKRVLAWAGKYNYILEADIDISRNISMPKKQRELVAKSRGQLIIPMSTTEKTGYTNKPVNSWTNKLLKDVFSTHIYKDTPNNKIIYTPLHFWLFPVALFHGMRAREISQLSVDDVVNINGIYCFAVNDSKPYQRVKNIESRRFVPVHDYLLNEIGFIDYLKWRQSLEVESDLLFLTPITVSFLKQNGLHNKISRQIRAEVGIPPRSGYNTHSFRHLFIDELRKAQFPTWQIARVVGHDAKGHKSVTDEYGVNRLNISELQAIVNAFLPPVDLPQLKWKRFKCYVTTKM